MNKLYAGLLAGILIVIIVGAAAWYVWFYQPTAPAKNKIGLVLATGGLGDKSFNDIAYAGCLRAQDELGIVFDKAEPKAISEYEGFQTNFAKTGEYALIICIGFDQADALNKTAQAYPNQKFVIVDMVVDLPNVASLTFRANEASFLVGTIAGSLTGSGKVGFVGGMDIPLIRDFYVGYKAGVEWANPDATVLTPVFVGGWADPTKGKELAVSLIEDGADGIFAAAGKSGLGALEAVDEKGTVMGFGVDSCQDYLYPSGLIAASATKRVDVAVYEMINATMTGTFHGGTFSGGLKEKWAGCSRLPSEESFWEATFNFTEPALPDNAFTKLIEADAGIVAGTITVPSGYT